MGTMTDIRSDEVQHMGTDAVSKAADFQPDAEFTRIKELNTEEEA